MVASGLFRCRAVVGVYTVVRSIVQVLVLFRTLNRVSTSYMTRSPENEGHANTGHASQHREASDRIRELARISQTQLGIDRARRIDSGGVVMYDDRVESTLFVGSLSLDNQVVINKADRRRLDRQSHTFGVHINEPSTRK
jgi:hypothetical protein